MGWRIFVVFFGGHPPPSDLFFKKPYYNIVKVTSHLHEINKLGNISPLENANLFPDYHYWLRRPISGRKRKMGEGCACVGRPLLWMISWLLSSLCHSIGCFLFLPLRDTVPPSTSEAYLLRNPNQIPFSLLSSPEHLEVADLKLSI